MGHWILEVVKTLLDLAFFVSHMLTDHGIKFFDLHLFRHVLFVFGRGIEVAGAGARYQFDLVAHRVIPRSDVIAAFTDIGKDGINALLVDRPKALTGHLQTDEPIFTFNPETMFMEVWVEDAFGLVVSVRDVMAYNTALARHLAYSGHG